MSFSQQSLDVAVRRNCAGGAGGGGSVVLKAGSRRPLKAGGSVGSAILTENEEKKTSKPRGVDVFGDDDDGDDEDGEEEEDAESEDGEVSKSPTELYYYI